MGAALAAVGLAPPVVAQEMLRVSQGTFSEALLSNVPVSGGIRVGVLTGAVDAPVNLASLNVRLPALRFRTLCVDIVSRDARYQAHVEYDVSSVSSAVYRLQFPTAHGAELRRYRARELAVLAQLTNEGCHARTQAVVVASWETEVRDKAITVLINAGGLDTQLSSSTKGGQRVWITCSQVPGTERRTAYDTECRLASEDDADLSRVVIMRRHFENFLEPIALPILVR